MKFTFYMFTEAAKTFEDCLEKEKLSGDEPFIQLPLKKEPQFSARAYMQVNKATTPRWIEFFEGYVTFPPDVQNVSNSMVFIINQGGRFFAVTTGYGHTAVSRSRMQTDFGLRVTLNTIDPDHGMRGLDARRFDNKASQKRLLLSKEGSLGDFEFNLEEDLLRMVAGVPSKAQSKLGTRMVGADSLSLTADMTLPQLGKKCESLLKAFRKKTYKKRFEFIDYVVQVKDSALQGELDAVLDEAFTARSTDHLLLVYPEIDFWQKAERFVVSKGQHKVEMDDVSLKGVYDFLDENDLKDAVPSKVHVIGVDGDGNPATQRRPLVDYVVFETKYKDEHYLFTLKKWNKIDDAFVKRVEKDVRTIPELPSSFLPPTLRRKVKAKNGEMVRRIEKEGVYNSRVEKKNKDKFVCFDKKLFHGFSGNSSIEVCDLLSKQRHFVAVKKYNGSATLSHLFAQAYVSAECFCDLKEYRQQTANTLPKAWPPLFDLDEPDLRQITFVYAIADAPAGRVASGLPFFSKVNLRRTTKAIKRMGYQVSIARIEVKG